MIYRLSSKAEKSLFEIKSYSLKNFDTTYTILYINRIQKRMRLLATNPIRGITRPDLKIGWRSSFVGSHVIYFRAMAVDEIEIIDILHEQMEPVEILTEFKWCAPDH